MLSWNANALLNILFPTPALGKKQWSEEDEWKQMRKELTPILLTKSMLEMREIRHIDTLLARGWYAASPLLQSAIHRFKYQRKKDDGNSLGILLTEAIPALMNTNNVPYSPVLCPVPLHWTREFMRGFNQASVLAAVIGQIMQWEVMDMLRRTRATGHQAHRSVEERKHALKNAFSLKKNTHVPPWIILIDDICTTGTTLSECACVLKKAGVKYVSALVLAEGR